MLFWTTIGVVAAAIPTAMLIGVYLALRDGRIPRSEQLKRQWAKAGAVWTGSTDPALPPPTAEQARDLAAMEAYTDEHNVEIAVRQACERASHMYLHCGYTVEGAREEAARETAKAFSYAHGYQLSRQVRQRMKEMPVELLLNDEAMEKLVTDTDRISEALERGGMEAADKVSKRLGLGEEPGLRIVK